jgi:hypothetical protein
LPTETLSIWVPGLAKAESDDTHRRVCGLASSEDEDQQGETILQKGIDFSPLVSHGHINWNHQSGPKNVIGEPTVVEFRDTRNGYGLYMEGVIYKGTENSDGVWQLICAVEEARKTGASKRQLGWSVEGGIVARNPQNKNIIEKSIVRHMAVTHEPVNAKTYLELAKSLGHTWAGIPEFDAGEIVHHTFETVDALAKGFGVGLLKTMSANVGVAGAGDMAPLQTPQRVKSKKHIAESAADFLCELGDECDGSCKKVKKGGERVLTHLVVCNHLNVEDAFTIVEALAKTLG